MNVSSFGLPSEAGLHEAQEQGRDTGNVMQTAAGYQEETRGEGRGGLVKTLGQNMGAPTLPNPPHSLPLCAP